MVTGAVTGAPENLGDTPLADDTPETCDRCGPAVRAGWLVFTPAGALTFCGAHYRRYKKAREGQ